MTYKPISSKVIFRGKVLTVKVDVLESPSGRVVEREVVEHRGAVGMVPVRDNGEVILVDQYRHAVKGDLLEIPAGKLDPGERPVDCARRELVEEIGYEASEVRELARFYTTPGYSNEYFHLFLVRGLTEAAQGEVEEEITGTVSLTFEAALKMIGEGGIEDGKTIAALCLAKTFLEDHD